MILRYQLPSPYLGVSYDPSQWAQFTFGSALLGDQRRTRRLVRIASDFMRQPHASLPAQARSLAALKAAYRWFESHAISHSAILAPHTRSTRGRAGAEPLVLLVQDTTTLDFTHHPTTEGLGPIDSGIGRGFFVHSSLAIVPQPRFILGLAHQLPFVRTPAPESETRAQRRKRPRESQIWEQTARAIGSPPPGSTWVHVGDAYSDIFDFIAACREQRADFLLRAAQNRRVQLEDGKLSYVFTLARELPSQASRTLELPSRPKRSARTATLQVGWRKVCLLAPVAGRKRAGQELWVVRVWEEQEDVPEGEEGLEWVLLTSVAVESVADGWERAEWYTCRWVVEDYHMGLKTGCQIEKRQLQTQAGLERLLGVLAPVAVQLVQVRELARLEEERKAAEVLPAEVVEVVAAVGGEKAERLTVGRCWRLIAQQGGYLGRKGDGPPGWKTLWRGWMYIQTLLEGIHLSRRLFPDRSG
jgi:hypothetical protein